MAGQKLLDRVREQIRSRYYSIRTERAYLYWIRQFIRFHRLRHPADLTGSHVARFLTHLAVERRVAPNTQKAALNALVFLYAEVLGRSDLEIPTYRRASTPPKLPVVLSPTEIRQILGEMETPFRLCAELMYGGNGGGQAADP